MKTLYYKAATKSGRKFMLTLLRAQGYFMPIVSEQGMYFILHGGHYSASGRASRVTVEDEAPEGAIELAFNSWFIEAAANFKLYAIDFTYAEHMDGKCSHREYFAQFVNSRVRETVLRNFTVEALVDAYRENEHFNSIPLEVWDGLPCPLQSVQVRIAKDQVSISFKTCVLKEAAEQIVEKEIGKKL